MMLFHVHGFTDPQEQIHQARALAGFVAAAQDEHDLYRKFLKEEMEQFLKQDGNYVFHDALAEFNTPFYFFQFMAAAEARGLTYLGEADFHVMLDLGLPAGVGQKLDELSGNRVAREQYLDFLRCRRFRQTLLCHQEVPLQLALKPEQIADFYIAGFVRCLSPEPAPQATTTEQFENREGARIQTNSTLAKTAFAMLTDEWPQAIAYSELLNRTKQKLIAANQWNPQTEAREEFEFKAALFRSYAAGLLELHTYAPKVFREVSARPKASPLTQWQTRQANFVSSLFHTAVQMEEPLLRELIGHLDGTRDREALLRELEAMVDRQREASGALGKPIANDPPARELLRQALDRNLEKLARMGLLAA
jgi:methyltransferase-like protein